MASKALAPDASGRVAARIAEIDMLRGLVIVLMALDHVRDYFHNLAFSVNPLDPDQTTPLLYSTRWITHLCAPVFVVLSGISAWLQFSNGKTIPHLSLFLFTRGLWLIVLEMTVISFGWSFGFPLLLFLQVIWAIGWSMLALAALVWLPRAAVLLVGVAIVAGHNLLDPILPEQLGNFAWLWMFLHEGGVVPNFETPMAYLAYPVLPWIGVIALGYGLGPIFLQVPGKRERTLLLLGLAMLAAFFVLRWFNLYGDPTMPTGWETERPTWREETTPTAAVMTFFNVQKYPPSLQFVLVTLGIVFSLWPLLARLRGPAAKVLNTFGAVPFFFYILHIYLVHVLAIAANAAAGNSVEGYLNYMRNVFTAWQLFEGVGFSLPWVYLAWIVVLVLLYPLCAWFAAVKRARRDWWLSYL
ncbi:MAG: DUF1624 domain-containing protein [Hyphomonadaceae bacterium]